MRRVSPLITLLVALMAAASFHAKLVGAEPPIPAANQSLLQSERWRELMHQFDEWASVQRLYDPQQIKQFRATLIQKASTLTGNDLQNFLEDLEARLSILGSAEARAARQWLSQTLSVASDSYAAKVRARYPSVANLTASQLQEKLDEFTDRRADARRSSEDFARTRQVQFEAVQAANERAAEQSRNQAQNAGSFSGYHPGSTNNNNNNNSNYGVPRFRPAIPIFGGGFFW